LRQTECLSASLHHMSVPFTIITNSYSKMFMLQQDVYVTARCLCVKLKHYYWFNKRWCLVSKIQYLSLAWSNVCYHFVLVVVSKHVTSANSNGTKKIVSHIIYIYQKQ